MNPVPLRVACALAVTLSIGITGCSSCGRQPAPDGNRLRESPPDIPPAAAPEPWQWRPTSPAAYALPTGCSFSDTPRRHDMDTARLLFLAMPDDTDHLAVAQAGEGSDVTTLRGLLSIRDARVGDLPWTHLSSPPVMGSADGRWLAVLAHQEATSSHATLWLWRHGSPMEAIANGDQLAAVDARCGKTACAVLTTRPAEVASPGATVWQGRFDQPVAAWRRQDVAIDFKSARPLSIAGHDDSEPRTTIALDTQDGVAFFDVSTTGSRLLGAVPHDGSILDTVMLPQGPVAFSVVATRTPEGCAPAGVRLRLLMPGHEPQDISLPAVPESGYARRVGNGALLVWIARVNCKDPRRKVVQSLLVTRDGQAGPFMTVGDADGFALASAGNGFLLWLREEGGVTMLRGACSTD